MSDLRQYASATARNRDYILKVLLRVLPPTGNILELASGTGEHAVYFAPCVQPRQWFPSDPNPGLRDSIRAWAQEYPSPNLHPPLAIDVTDHPWLVESQNLDIQALVNINMIHISPWGACQGLMAGASRILPSRGILYLYGPFKQQGKHTASSNEAFDLSLRSQNPLWGVRNLEDVIALAQQQGLGLLEVVPMPANNLSLVLTKY